MTISITNFQLHSSLPSLAEINRLSIPAKVAVRLIRINRKLEALHSDFTATAKKIGETYGDKDASGEFIPDQSNVFGVKLRDTEKVNSEYGDLLRSQVTIDEEPILIEALGDVKISVVTLATLDWLLKDELPVEPSTQPVART
jgi:hypothetical protein